MAVQTGTQDRAAQSELALGERGHRTLWGDAFRQFRRHRMAMIGLVIFSFLVFAVVVDPFIYQQPVNGINLADKLQPPSLAHPFGTDDLGQDVLSRVLTGGRISIAVGIVSVIIAITIGIILGALSGYLGGAVDTILMRFTDLMIALPALPLLLLVVYLFRDRTTAALGVAMGTFLLIVGVIGALAWMRVARLVRAELLSIKEKEYIEAARATGVPGFRIVMVHMLPNALSPVIVAASLGVAAAILTESTLSFLGLGFPPDFPTWGRIINDAQGRLDTAWWWAVAPGLCIFFAVLSINFIGDGLRDALDPRKTQ